MDEYAASGRWWVLVKTGIKIQDFRQKQEQLQFPEEAGLIHFARKGDISAVMPNLHCWSQQEHRVKWERQTILRATEVWCNEKNQLQCRIIFAGDIYSYRPLSSTFQAFSGTNSHQMSAGIGPATTPSTAPLQPQGPGKSSESCWKKLLHRCHLRPHFMLINGDCIMLINGFAAFHTWKPVNGKVGSDMMSVSVNGKALKPIFLNLVVLGPY